MNTRQTPASPLVRRSIVPDLRPRLEREAARGEFLWEESAILHHRSAAIRRRTMRVLAEAAAAITRSQTLRAAAVSRWHPDPERRGEGDRAG